jgi:hypothetical protein
MKYKYLQTKENRDFKDLNDRKGKHGRKPPETSEKVSAAAESLPQLAGRFQLRLKVSLTVREGFSRG